MKRMCALLVFAFSLTFCCHAFSQTRTVALSGEQAPGLPDLSTFSQFSRAVLNDHGQVALIASSESVSGVWSEGVGRGLALVARTTPTSQSGIRFTGFQRLVLNNQGQLVIEASFAGGSSPNASGLGLWTSGINGPLDLLLHEGQLAPGHPDAAFLDEFLGNSFGTESPPILNDSGQLGFRGLLRGPGINGTINNDKGLWWNLGPGVTPVAFSRDTMSGLANGRDSVGFGQPVINNRGQMLYVDFGIEHGVVVVDPSGMIMPIVTTADGFSEVSSLSPARINDAGAVTFIATRLSTGRSIWIRPENGALTRIIGTGELAPGAGGLHYKTIGNPIINAGGEIAFVGSLDGPGVVDVGDHFGIWSSRNGPVGKVVLLGDTAPGLDNFVFKQIHQSFTFNRIGQIAIQGLAGPVGGPFTQQGIWATDQIGQLQLIASAGTQIDVDNGIGVDLRTISTVSMLIPDVSGTGNEDGLASAFNEKGQLTFLATFSDGSRGVFVSNAVAVPEPSSVVPALAVAFAAVLLRSHRRMALRMSRLKFRMWPC